MGLRDSLTQFEWNKRDDGRLVWVQKVIESAEYPKSDECIRVDEWKACIMTEDTEDQWLMATEFSYHQAFFPAEMDLSTRKEEKINQIKDFYICLLKM